MLYQIFTAGKFFKQCGKLFMLWKIILWSFLPYLAHNFSQKCCFDEPGSVELVEIKQPKFNTNKHICFGQFDQIKTRLIQFKSFLIKKW